MSVGVGVRQVCDVTIVVIAYMDNYMRQTKAKAKGAMPKAESERYKENFGGMPICR